MIEKSSFRLTFHVFHPSISASEIEGNFDLPVKLSQSVGSRRQAKSGKILGGDYSSTNVIFCPHDESLKFDDESLTTLIKEQMKRYNIDYVYHLVSTGGYCNFMLGLFSNANIMFELDNEIISLLSKSKISIKFDFYGGED